MSIKSASDLDRMSAASKFFWETMERWNGPIITPHQAHRHIKALAECLPPFTRIKPTADQTPALNVKEANDG